MIRLNKPAITARTDLAIILPYNKFEFQPKTLHIAIKTNQNNK